MKSVGFGSGITALAECDERCDVVLGQNVVEGDRIESVFELAWTEGTALSVEMAVTYALRGRGERKRPTSGWAALTPAEQGVVRLVGEGLPNKDIATRLFVSPRTVQSHLTHIYTKLGVSSRVQLAQEASRHV